MKRKDETVKFLGVDMPKWSHCMSCGKKYSCEFLPTTHYGYATRCSNCEKKHIKETSRKEKTRGWGIQKYKDMIAFGYDRKTRQPFWLDKKGNRVRHDDRSVMYDLYNDPHGWRKIGKKVKKYNS